MTYRQVIDVIAEFSRQSERVLLIKRYEFEFKIESIHYIYTCACSKILHRIWTYYIKRRHFWSKSAHFLSEWSRARINCGKYNAKIHGIATKNIIKIHGHIVVKISKIAVKNTKMAVLSQQKGKNRGNSCRENNKNRG